MGTGSMTCPQDFWRELVETRKGRENPPLAISGIRNQSGPIMWLSYRYRALTAPNEAPSTGTALPPNVKIGSAAFPLDGNISCRV